MNTTREDLKHCYHLMDALCKYACHNAEVSEGTLRYLQGIRSAVWDLWAWG